MLPVSVVFNVLRRDKALGMTIAVWFICSLTLKCTQNSGLGFDRFEPIFKLQFLFRKLAVDLDTNNEHLDTASDAHKRVKTILEIKKEQIVRNTEIRTPTPAVIKRKLGPLSLIQR